MFKNWRSPERHEGVQSHGTGSSRGFTYLCFKFFRILFLTLKRWSSEVSTSCCFCELKVDNRDSETPKITPEQAIALCDRNFGVGGDGVIFVLPGNNGSDYAMRIYNSDGSEPEVQKNIFLCIFNSDCFSFFFQSPVEWAGLAKELQTPP